MLVAAIALAALSGCTATTALPEPLSDTELDERVTAELDRQWEFTGLDGVVERPQPPVEKVTSIDGFSAEFSQCMADAGFAAWGVSERGLDMTMVNSDRAPSTPEQQLSFYRCTARFPGVDTLSPAQQDFVYDYYRSWLIPCIELQGYEITAPPTREGFHTSRADVGWQWAPYGALVDPPGNDVEWSALQRRCAPTVPGLEGWSDPYGH